LGGESLPAGKTAISKIASGPSSTDLDRTRLRVAQALEEFVAGYDGVTAEASIWRDPW
jgi:hypothetical protein